MSSKRRLARLLADDSDSGSETSLEDVGPGRRGVTQRRGPKRTRLTLVSDNDDTDDDHSHAEESTVKTTEEKDDDDGDDEAMEDVPRVYPAHIVRPSANGAHRSRSKVPVRAVQPPIRELPVVSLVSSSDSDDDDSSSDEDDEVPLSKAFASKLPTQAPASNPRSGSDTSDDELPLARLYAHTSASSSSSNSPSASSSSSSSRSAVPQAYTPTKPPALSRLSKARLLDVLKVVLAPDQVVVVGATRAVYRLLTISPATVRMVELHKKKSQFIAYQWAALAAHFIRDKWVVHERLPGFRGLDYTSQLVRAGDVHTPAVCSWRGRAPDLPKTVGPSSLYNWLLLRYLVYAKDTAKQRARVLRDELLNSVFPHVDLYKITSARLQRMLEFYDRLVFDGHLGRAIKRKRVMLSMQTSGRLKSTAGQYQPPTSSSGRRMHTITIAHKMVLKLPTPVRTRINGVKCSDRLAVLMSLFEHELSHFILHVFCPSWMSTGLGGHTLAFRHLVLHVFGHTHHRHELLSGNIDAHDKAKGIAQHAAAALKKKLRVGDLMYAVYNGNKLMQWSMRKSLLGNEWKRMKAVLKVVKINPKRLLFEFKDKTHHAPAKFTAPYTAFATTQIQ